MKVTGQKINVGLLLQAIADGGYAGYEEAARALSVAPVSFNKLFKFNGDLPRFDALLRISNGLKVKLCDLIVMEGADAAASEKNVEPEGRVLPGRWPLLKVVGHDGEAVRGAPAGAVRQGEVRLR